MKHVISDDVVLKARAAAVEELAVWRISEIPAGEVAGLSKNKAFVVDDEPRFLSKHLQDKNGNPIPVFPPETKVMQAKCVSYEQAQAFVTHQTWRVAIATALEAIQLETEDVAGN